MRPINVVKPHVNVGTIGRVDHGKATLTAAICAVQIHLRETSLPVLDAFDSKSKPEQTIKRVFVSRSSMPTFDDFGVIGNKYDVKGRIVGSKELADSLSCYVNCQVATPIHNHPWSWNTKHIPRKLLPNRANAFRTNFTRTRR